MPADPLVVIAAAALVGLALVGTVFAWSWKAWIDLRRHALDTRGEGPAVANRIDLADLRERIRKLEAIAAGVDI